LAAAATLRKRVVIVVEVNRATMMMKVLRLLYGFQPVKGALGRMVWYRGKRWIE
jgi:hypothetical protein